MTNVPYVKLRRRPDGSVRPRFEPGPRERALGFVAEDLKHEDGEWFTVDEAAEYAAQKHRHIDQARRTGGGAHGGPPRRRNRRPVQWVYFIVAGDWVKIGTSRVPLRRVAQLSTGSPVDTSMLLAVRGTSADEAKLHRMLARYRHRGEWFGLAPAVRAVMQLSLDFGRVTFPKQKSGGLPEGLRLSIPVCSARKCLSY